MKESAIKYIPVISALLLFVGYINYTSYYSLFDIEISTFLSTGELILSFLPLTIPILFILAVLLLQVLPALVVYSMDRKNKPDQNTSEKSPHLYLFKESLLNLLNSIRNKELKTAGGIFSFFLNIVFLITGALIIAFFGAYLWVLVKGKLSYSYLDTSIPEMIFLAIFWIYMLYELIDRVHQVTPINYKALLKLICIFALFLGLVRIANSDKANKVLAGKPEYEIKFNCDSVQYQTDSNLVFIGKTNNNIFLRNLKDKRNLIFDMKGVSLIEMKKKN